MLCDSICNVSSFEVDCSRVVSRGFVFSSISTSFSFYRGIVLN